MSGGSIPAARFERATFGSGDRRSNPLSYAGIISLNVFALVKGYKACLRCVKGFAIAREHVSCAHLAHLTRTEAFESRRRLWKFQVELSRKMGIAIQTIALMNSL